MIASADTVAYVRRDRAEMHGLSVKISVPDVRLGEDDRLVGPCTRIFGDRRVMHCVFLSGRCPIGGIA